MYQLNSLTPGEFIYVRVAATTALGNSTLTYAAVPTKPAGSPNAPASVRITTPQLSNDLGEPTLYEISTIDVTWEAPGTDGDATGGKPVDGCL